ncbi:SDR family NAD(P)-dependent oxidoreductase [Candidatus Galacturonibacter soehngenii]|uniref:SDR family NAD(P)-dependent oxidoreductase n=1 Tax=Candidatus Galacturonatibacter soehngenii TaxID=2307010 RepID=A0A7V7QLQ8_9FIRM|nr:SDR family NAD(P)-dependent oxidoreductase [Candidatus Galacturonibacter soehngenii]KAB1438673.1 SDR family NAD(P)-dependent oxidoreductase [Candidatus Galacturonibacter soehngenii]MBA4685713.1 SDR family NAD(P)-dependent oxidoreductase [Candidatus Galacturonibacter soehngenii]
MQLENKVMVVTGGGNGVGRELVLTLLNKGAKVAAVDLNKNGLDETYALSGKNKKLSLHTVNISEQEAVNNLVEEVTSYHGQVDGIINCAGIIQPFIDVDEIDMDQINKVMNVNFFGTLYMTKAFLPVLKKRPEAHITNVSSMGGFFPVPGQSIYGASKAAVKLMTEALYAELNETNVGVSVIIPGGIATNIMKNSEIGGKTADMNAKGVSLLLTPNRAAKLIISCIEKNKFRMFIGKDANLMNILYKFHPKLAIKLMKKMLELQ